MGSFALSGQMIRAQLLQRLAWHGSCAPKVNAAPHMIFQGTGDVMGYETLLTHDEGAACIVQLNRPQQKNAINAQMMSELSDALAKAEAEPDIRAVIITGAHSYFSSGADLREAQDITSHAASSARSRLWQQLTGQIEQLQKPVIAAIEGFCFTGGWELVMACDLRIAAQSARFSITSAKIGTVPGAGATQRLPRQVGVSAALDILFAAEPIAAQEALRLGAINRLCSDGEALMTAKALVALYESRAPLSLAGIKRAVRLGQPLDLASGLDIERHIVAEIYQSEDKAEGISAFLEKRQPKFTGR